MNQIPMSSVNFNHPEPCFASPSRCSHEGIDDLLNAVHRERMRQRIILRERYGARCDDVRPTTRLFRNFSIPFPRVGRAQRVPTACGDTACGE